VLAVTSLVGCAPDNIEFRRLDDVPYHPTNAANLVVGSWADLQALAGQAPAVADRVVDVHRSDPAPPAGAPVIIRVPGGAWVHHNQNTLPEYLERYVDRGWVVVTVGYTRADAGLAAKQWPVQGHEIDWVVRWVKANATALGVSANKVVLLGDSAGAHLSAQVATGVFNGGANPALPAPSGGDPALSSLSSKPNALVLLSGAYDLGPEGVPKHPGFPAQGVPPFWQQEALLGCDPSTPACAPRIAAASVVHATDDADLGNFPPTFIGHGDSDEDTPLWLNAVRLGQQLCDNTFATPGGGTHRIRLSQELVVGEDHDLATLDWAKVDYFLYRQGLLAPVPVATTTWTCNQP
jgi:acetyl esterase/lipase